MFKCVGTGYLLPENALTVGEIAREIGCQVHRVEYLIRSRDIKPIIRAGNARVFSENDVEFIRAEIRRIDERRNP